MHASSSSYPLPRVGITYPDSQEGADASQSSVGAVTSVHVEPDGEADITSSRPTGDEPGFFSLGQARRPPLSKCAGKPLRSTRARPTAESKPAAGTKGHMDGSMLTRPATFFEALICRMKHSYRLRIAAEFPKGGGARRRDGFLLPHSPKNPALDFCSSVVPSSKLLGHAFATIWRL